MTMKSSAKKSATRKRAARKAGSGNGAGASGVKVRVRMYRQGLGDCFLVTFFTGGATTHMLIDCGTLGAKTTQVKMPDVIKDIHDTTGGHLHILVATHEHKDHLSGFQGDPSPFDEFDVDRVLVAWTEDPTDELAKKISKHKGDLRLAVTAMSNALAPESVPDDGERDAVHETRSGMREILSFFGDVPHDGQMLGATLAKGIDEAMRYVTTRAGDNVQFLMPGTLVDDPPEGLRFYVLGPPQDESALRNMGEHGSAELYSLAAQVASDLTACADFSVAAKSLEEYRRTLTAIERQQFDARLPFDMQYRIDVSDERDCREKFSAYFDESDAWRQIDNDWLSGGSELALQLDSYTNNTSLVLAIELIDDGRVLLFPADAQVGNWESWHDYTWSITEADGSKRDVNAADLLSRTVFYKVGHHSSHNATVKADGLELMERSDLVAMIPVDRKVALAKDPPWQMPAKELYARLVEKTRGRVVRSDTGWPDDSDRPNALTKNEWEKAREESGITIEEMFIDFELR